MPDPPFDRVQESMKFVGAVSFEGDPICFGPNETRPPPGGGSPLRYASDSVLSSVSSGSSSQHDEAEVTTDEDTTDVPEAVLMPMRSRAITPMNESDNHLYWRHREPRLFEDTPGQVDISSGLGYYECMMLMALPEEPQHDADPQQQVQRRPVDLLLPSTPIVTFQVPGFSMGLAGGIVPFAEWQTVEDPDGVGLENLDIFMDP